MELSKLSEPVPQSRIGKKQGKGGKSMDYVTARFCMDRLDQSVGPMNWRNEYKEICGQLICGVSIFDTQINDWVTKWDVGTESNFEAEKGHFSDAFKRACVHWGIARELYHEGDEAFEDSGEEASAGVAGSVPPESSPWESVEVHFGKNKGVKLGDLPEKSLSWYQEKWESKNPSDQDKILREALDKSLRKGEKTDGFDFGE